MQIRDDSDPANKKLNVPKALLNELVASRHCISWYGYFQFLQNIVY